MDKKLNDLMNEYGISEEDKPKFETLLDDMSRSMDELIIDLLCESFSTTEREGK